jgi:hypothetical protein
MKHLTIFALACGLALAACGKKSTDKPAVQPSVATTETKPTSEGPAPAPAATPAPADAAPAQQSPQAGELAKKQALLAYGEMENGYITDSRAQWAKSAKASSSFGSANDEPPGSRSSYAPWQATGMPNNEPWLNNSRDIGFDWLELAYDKPVSANEVRVVFTQGVEAINKIELIDTDGKAHPVWSGIGEMKAEDRGARTWFVRKFDATPYKVNRVKVTVANSLADGPRIDAVQLVGD